MIGIRHCGIYVDDIQIMENFYSNVFDMKYICRQRRCEGDFDRVLDRKGTIVLMTKLITPKGAITHEGDMVELLHVVSPNLVQKHEKSGAIYDSGMIHIAFECEIGKTLEIIDEFHGRVLVDPIVMQSGNRMCFISDPENNVIELIDRRQDI